MVLFDSALYGTQEGPSFEVEAETEIQESSGDYATRSLETMTMEADLEAKILSGEITQTDREEDNDGYSYSCEVTYNFTAERVSSPDSRYPEG